MDDPVERRLAVLALADLQVRRLRRRGDVVARPAPHTRTPVLAYSLKIEPAQHFINWQQDPFGNYLARLVFPEPTRVLTVDVDLVAEMTVINPFDFFLEESAEQISLRYERQLRRELAPIWRSGRGAVAAGRGWPKWTARAVHTVGFPGRAQPAPATRHRLHHPHGAGRAELRGDARASGSGSCRDSGLAAGADPAPSRAGGALRVRLPGPAHRRRQGARRPVRSEATSPTCTPGPRCTCRAPAGSGSIRPPGCSPAKGHIPLACTPTRQRGAGHRRHRSRARSSSIFDEQSPASTRTRASPSPTATNSGRGSTRSAGGRRATARRRRAADHGRRADLRVDRRHGWPEWNIAAVGPTSAAAERAAAAPARPLRGGGFGCCTRPGQVVSGRAAAALGADCYWRSDGEPVWHDESLLADDEVPHTAMARNRRKRFAVELTRRLG
jgi:hypothetical protein